MSSQRLASAWFGSAIWKSLSSGRQLLIDVFEQTQVFEQLPLEAQGVQRAAQALGFGLAGFGECDFGFGDGGLHARSQLLGARGAPEGAAHVLD